MIRNFKDARHRTAARRRAASGARVKPDVRRYIEGSCTLRRVE
jgi:hypothetical protein